MRTGPQGPLTGVELTESGAGKLDWSPWPRKPNSGKQGRVLSRKLGGVWCCLQGSPSYHRTEGPSTFPTLQLDKRSSKVTNDEEAGAGPPQEAETVGKWEP